MTQRGLEPQTFPGWYGVQGQCQVEVHRIEQAPEALMYFRKCKHGMKYITKPVASAR